ncbi:MAG: hypothetical protein FIA95_15550 [Gemmatimonadetes bacterium]|nr:hypothetical protein [Gemmatimonadota bacterium]
MRILIVGNGGREHALLWKLRREAPGAEFFATQPNGGMAPLCTAVPIAPTDVEALSGWAASHRMDLTVVGPEAPLAAGLADRLQAKGLPVFGPSREAARIESSKAYAKELMRSAGIPTAEHRTFRDREAAEAWVRERGAPIVVKAPGWRREKARWCAARWRRPWPPLPPCSEPSPSVRPAGRWWWRSTWTARSCRSSRWPTGSVASSSSPPRTTSAWERGTLVPTREGWVRTRRSPSPRQRACGTR